MTRVVWKYELEMEDYQDIEMPLESTILCVQKQRDKPCMWALVDPDDKERCRYTIRIAGTGHPIKEEDHKYIGTFQMMDGNLVFHVFAVDRRKMDTE